jgi:Ca2+-binding RTX toxin-like protein
MASLFLSFFESDVSPFLHLHLENGGLTFEFSYELAGKPVSKPFDGSVVMTLDDFTTRDRVRLSDTDNLLSLDFNKRMPNGHVFDFGYTLTDNNSGFTQTIDYKLVRFTEQADYAGSGRFDVIFGSGQDDVFRGGGGKDFINGFQGEDRIVGGASADMIDGGRDSDSLTGGPGADKFVFSVIGADQFDRITDFTVGSDTIWLDDAIFPELSRSTSGPEIMDPADFVANTTGRAVAFDDIIIYETDTGKIFYDPDGTGSSGRQLIARIDANAGLSAADFMVF